MILRLRQISLCGLLLLLTACAGGRFSTPNASGYYNSSAVQCVPYARDHSNVKLYGDAHTWWDQAPSRYPYGQMPQPGAILVLSQTARMTHGHLAVVKNIVGPRAINVTHSNWGSDWNSRRVIYESMRVEDVSPANDWSLVHFWNHKAQAFGFPYPARGFIYPRSY